MQFRICRVSTESLVQISLKQTKSSPTRDFVDQILNGLNSTENHSLQRQRYAKF
jgi:hypothetical protein